MEVVLHYPTLTTREGNWTLGETYGMASPYLRYLGSGKGGPKNDEFKSSYQAAEGAFIHKLLPCDPGGRSSTLILRIS